MMNNPRIDYAALTFSLAAHASLLLAWQPPATPPVEETVLSAVLLPPLKAQQENRPEPPLPARTPQASAPPARAAASPVREMAAELSDQFADAPAALPAAQETRSVSLSGARSPAAALPAAAAGTSTSLSEGESHSQADNVGSAPVQRLAGPALQTSRPMQPRAHDAAPAIAGYVPAATATTAQQPPAALAWARAQAATAFAAQPQDMPAAAVPGDNRSIAQPPPPAQPGEYVAASLAAASGAAKAVQNAMAPGDPHTAAPPDSSHSAPETPAPARLAGGKMQFAQARPGGSNPPAALLADGLDASAQAVPGGSTAASLARAAPGRPVAVSGGAEGAFDSPDYADNNPEFVYPRQAVRLGLEGTVILEVEVFPDGRPGEIRIKRSSGHDLLDRDARQQMANWRFKPATRGGRALASRVIVPITYRLDSKGRP